MMSGHAAGRCCNWLAPQTMVVPLRQGDAVAFAVHNRPVGQLSRLQSPALRQPRPHRAASHRWHHLPRNEVTRIMW